MIKNLRALAATLFLYGCSDKPVDPSAVSRDISGMMPVIGHKNYDRGIGNHFDFNIIIGGCSYDIMLRYDMNRENLRVREKRKDDTLVDYIDWHNDGFVDRVRINGQLLHSNTAFQEAYTKICAKIDACMTERLKSSTGYN